MLRCRVQYVLVGPNMKRSDRRKLEKIISKAEKRQRISPEEAQRLLGRNPRAYASPIDLDSMRDMPHYGYEDESGDLGRSEDSSPQLTSAVVVTEYPEYFRYVTESYPKNTLKRRGQDGEHKFTNAEPWVIESMLNDVMAVEPRIYASVTHKRDDDRTVPRHGPGLLISTVAESTRMMSEGESGRVDMIFDRHTALTAKKAERLCRYASSKGGTDVECIDYSGDSSKEPGLQIADLMAGSVGIRYSEGITEEERNRYWRIIRRNTRIEER